MHTTFFQHIFGRYTRCLDHKKLLDSLLSILIIVGTLFFLGAINHGMALYYANKFCSLHGYGEAITGPKLNLYCMKLKDGNDELLLVPFDYRKES